MLAGSSFASVACHYFRLGISWVKGSIGDSSPHVASANSLDASVHRKE